jgi:hypothetical protein
LSLETSVVRQLRCGNGGSTPKATAQCKGCAVCSPTVQCSKLRKAVWWPLPNRSQCTYSTMLVSIHSTVQIEGWLSWCAFLFLCTAESGLSSRAMRVPESPRIGLDGYVRVRLGASATACLCMRPGKA